MRLPYFLIRCLPKQGNSFRHVHGYTSSQGCSNPQYAHVHRLPLRFLSYIRSPLYVPGDARTTPYGRRIHPSTADAGTPGIVKIIAAASKNAAGRFHFHFILFILLTLFVPSRCFLEAAGILPPAADIPSQASPKGVHLQPAALGFKLCLVANPQGGTSLLYPRMLMQKFIPWLRPP